MNPVINKFLVAIATVITALVVVLSDTPLEQLSAAQILTLVIVFLGALGVYAVPNATRNVPPVA